MPTKLFFLNKNNFIFLAAGALFFLYLVIWADINIKYYFLLSLLAIALLYFLSYHLTKLFYLVAVSFPFINLQIHATQNINAPLVDWLAVVLLVAWIIKIIRQKELKKIKSPYFLLFGIFLIIAVWSALSGFFMATSFKFIVRFILLSYIAYLIIPVNLLNEKNKLIKTVWLIFSVSVIIAFISLAQFLAQFNLNELPRAIPPQFGDFAPLGYNHNVLAELMAVVWPLGIFLALVTQNPKLKKFIYSGIGLFIVIMFLTLSRTAWLTFGLEISLFILLMTFNKKILNDFKKKFSNTLKKLFIPILIISLPLFLLMISLLTSPVVHDSNRNRLLQWQIGLDSYQLSPLLGAGPGSFISILNLDPYFPREFGPGLEAHGLPLKLISETGLLGLLTFSLFITVFFGQKILSLKNMTQDREKLILSCFLISGLGIVFFELFSTTYFTAKMWLPLGLLQACFYLYAKSPVKKKN